MRPSLKKSILAVLFGAAWLVAVGAGVRILLNYENAPGAAGAPPQDWPAQSQIQRSKDQATLIMMAHPHCPCTRASISELAEVMAQVQGKVRAFVLFYKPQDAEDDWEKTALWENAAAIPGVTVVSDLNGQESQRFHIETSGHTMLFDAAGHLIFSGGITASRGHEGENAGVDAIVSLLRDNKSDRNNTLVFGCSITEAEGNTTAWTK
jgi:hypothetical protein